MSTSIPEKPIVQVYVRLGRGGDGRSYDDVRTLSFQIPPDITQSELIRQGYAIDGTDAVMDVTASSEDDDEDMTLNESLSATQGWLLRWLEEKGYEAVFV